MSTDQTRIEQALRTGIAQGLLPAGAVLPAQDNRPWPVMLLTALGAWLAAIPLLGVVSLLLGDVLSKDAGPYIAGVLVLAVSVTVLRSRNLPVFVEQLAVPGLLVGGGALAFGLFRDLPDQAAAGVLAALSLALAFAIPRPWLRTLLGAAACALCVAMLMPERLLRDGRSAILGGWLALHGALLLWLAALAAQSRIAGPRWAGLIESVAAGWLLMLLTGLCWWSGMTFLVSGSLGGGLFGQLAGAAAGNRLLPERGLLPAASVALAIAAAALGARRWPRLRQPLAAPVALVLAALCWFMPSLGAVLLAMAWTGTTRRRLQAGAAAFAAAWIVGSFYYQLQWTLAHKAVVLVMAGALLGALAWAARRPGRLTAAPAPRFEPRPAALIALTAAAVLAAANFSIWQKESLIAQGEKVFVELAPLDPRSLMQGDYMRLNFRLPEAVDAELRNLVTLRRPHVAARRDARGVLQPLRIVAADAPLAPGEMRIELTPKDGRWILVSDAWFFREGDAQRWEAARYGEFRVLPDGRALLVGLADAKLQTIPVSR
jgi:uncharacterized membrane-anchored protein